MAGELSAATATGNTGEIAALCRHLEFFAGHPPLAITPLSNGELNFSYKIATARGLYAIRRYPQGDICRQQELRCQHAAAVAGIAPTPLCLNNHQQILISEYVNDGEPFSVTPERIPLLASTIATLHQLPVQTAVLQPVNYLLQLAKNISFTDAAEQQLFDSLLETAAQFQALPADEALCHLDLHQGNILWSSKHIWLLDFEYSQRADSCFDLAAIALYFKLTPAAEQQFLSAYWQHRNVDAAPTEFNTKLMMAKSLFSGFCWLWYLNLPTSPAEQAKKAGQWQHLLETQLGL